MTEQTDVTTHKPAIADSVLDLVGATPLVRLQRISPPGGAEILGKLEARNPAGSVKDRPARSMILRAEQRGEIRPGDTLIEPTSGNTGIALAMVAAMKGYRMVLIMPDNMTAERRAAMRAYGAEIVLVPIMDIDNAATGNGGKDALPQDHNRDWSDQPRTGR